jgi:hypothetical protein
MAYLLQIVPQIGYVLIISLFFTLLSVLCLYVVIRPVPPLSSIVEAAFVIFSVGIIGSCVGIISGLSRAPIAGTVLPAILASVGAFGVYVFGSERASSKITPAAVVVFVMSCFIAFLQSAAIRGGYDELEFCRTQYAQAAISTSTNALKNIDQIFGEYCSKVVSSH